MSTVSSPRRTSKSKSKPFSAEFVSIVVRIIDTRYAVDPIDPGEFGTQAWRLSKASGNHEVYDVIRTNRGVVECSCPSYISTHAGTCSLCKHGRALVQLGLLPTPTLPELAPLTPAKVRELVPQPSSPAVAAIVEPACCSPAEAVPCVACVEPTARHTEPSADTIFTTDPGDIESDPASWGPEADDVWTITEPDPVPVGDDDHERNASDDSWHAPFAFEPSAEDEADFQAWKGETATREHLDKSASLSLEALVEHVASHFRTWSNGAGDLIGQTLEELATKIRLTQAETPADYLARIEILDADIRDDIAAAGRDACPCHRGYEAYA